jgi:hypothetical protein
VSGRSVPNGEVLPRGKVTLSVRYEQTEYEELSEEAFIEGAVEAQSFEQMDRALLVSPTLTAGVGHGVELSASIGYFSAVGAEERVLDPHSGGTTLYSFDPDGLTDLWLNGKVAVVSRENHWLTLQGGLKAPTGRRTVDVALVEGGVEALGKASSPAHTSLAAPLPVGSGSWDGLVGAGFTSWLSGRAMLDVGGHLVMRTEADDVRLGNRLDAGAIATYRLSGPQAAFPRIWLFAQAAVQSIAMNEIEGEKDENSGGTTLYVSPGARLDLGSKASLWVSPQFPVAQDVNGNQVEARFRLVTEIVSFF